jgi:hypothetical protein
MAWAAGCHPIVAPTPFTLTPLTGQVGQLHGDAAWRGERRASDWPRLDPAVAWPPPPTESSETFFSLTPFLTRVDLVRGPEAVKRYDGLKIHLCDKGQQDLLEEEL